MQHGSITIWKASDRQEPVKQLLRAYYHYMYVELGLHAGRARFDAELANFQPSHYLPPDGALLIAWSHSRPAGCVALRRYTSSSCELKRMYVTPASRGQALGRRLLEAAETQALLMGFDTILLDTNEEMREAVRLYRKTGYEQIPAYCENENPHPLYFRKSLRT